MELVILIGVQASGKSSFYKQRFADTHLRLNLDMLKTRTREQILLAACLEAKQPVVIDNTNPTVADRARYIGPAKDAGFRVVGYYLASKVADCLARNAQRPEGQVVPEKGVWGTAGRLVRPTLAEGFEALWYVKIGEGGGFVVEPWSEEPSTQGVTP